MADAGQRPEARTPLCALGRRPVPLEGTKSHRTFNPATHECLSVCLAGGPRTSRPWTASREAAGKEDGVGGTGVPAPAAYSRPLAPKQLLVEGADRSWAREPRGAPPGASAAQRSPSPPPRGQPSCPPSPPLPSPSFRAVAREGLGGRLCRALVVCVRNLSKTAAGTRDRERARTSPLPRPRRDLTNSRL